MCLEQLAGLQVGRQGGQLVTQLRLVTKAVGLLRHKQEAGVLTQGARSDDLTHDQVGIRKRPLFHDHFLMSCGYTIGVCLVLQTSSVAAVHRWAVTNSS